MQQDGRKTQFPFEHSTYLGHAKEKLSPRLTVTVHLKESFLSCALPIDYWLYFQTEQWSNCRVTRPNWRCDLRADNITADYKCCDLWQLCVISSQLGWAYTHSTYVAGIRLQLWLWSTLIKAFIKGNLFKMLWQCKWKKIPKSKWKCYAHHFKAYW